VEQDLIDGVILLPDNLFYNTSAAGVIVVLRKNKPKDRKGKIVLVNANGEFRKGSPKNHLTSEGIRKIADGFAVGRQGDGFTQVITSADAAAKDFNLSPSLYIQADAGANTRVLSDIIRELRVLTKEEAAINTALDIVLEKIER